MDWEFGVSRCKLLYVGWINNKVLLCGTGNYIYHPVINQEKTWKKMCVCVCVCKTESVLYTETNTAL